jgi:FixJ family two-component response regulator
MTETAPLIYIVDDERSVRKSLKRLMESARFKTKTFASAKDFLNSGYQNKLGCLILDVVMSDMNGLELQKQLALSGSKIPIIFITANEDEEAYNLAMEAGAKGFFLKPFDGQTLINAIDLVLKHRTVELQS